MQRERQGKIKRCPFTTSRRVGPNLTTMTLNSCASSGQTQATPSPALFLLRDTIKAVKNQIQMFSSNTNTFVMYRDTRFKLISISLDCDNSSGRGIVRRII